MLRYMSGFIQRLKELMRKLDRRCTGMSVYSVINEPLLQHLTEPRFIDYGINKCQQFVSERIENYSGHSVLLVAIDAGGESCLPLHREPDQYFGHIASATSIL